MGGKNLFSKIEILCREADVVRQALNLVAGELGDVPAQLTCEFVPVVYLSVSQFPH